MVNRVVVKGKMLVKKVKKLTFVSYSFGAKGKMILKKVTYQKTATEPNFHYV